MKNFTKQLLLVLFFLFGILSDLAAQTPEGIVYQAEARDEQGALVSNEALDVRVTILRGDSRGEVVWEETHQVITNAYGLFTIVMGTGEKNAGDRFDALGWGLDVHYYRVQVKRPLEAEWTDMGTSQFLAVPYALHAKTAGLLINEAAIDPKTNLPGIPSQTWSLFGNRGTDPSKDVLGTSDLADMVVVTDNLERMRIFSDGDVNIDGITTTNKMVVTEEDVPRAFPRSISILDVRGLLIADSIAIAGGLDIGGNLKVHGDSVIIDKNIYVGGTGDFGGQLTVSLTNPLSGGDSDFGAYPLRVEGSSQGIAVKVDAGTPDGGNNFITFFDNGYNAIGRIEGQTAGEVASEPEYIFETSIYTAEVVAAGVNIGLSALPNACAGVGVVACPPEPSVVAISIAEEVLAIANLAGYEVFAFTNLGVTYESGSADYAEWLERLDPFERIMPGDIVGVKGGKVTRNTEGLNHFRVVSTNPAFLGNMPPEGKTEAFSRIAFLGQVPVKVRGGAQIGDYIIPSGLNDGTGLAISPDALNGDQVDQVVGVAWSALPSAPGISLVNMAIGLNANDLASVVKRQQQQIETLEDLLTSFEERINALETGNQRMQPQQPALTTLAEEPGMEEPPFPMVLDAQAIEESIMLLQDFYTQRGLDPLNHPGLRKLFTDETFRQEIIHNIISNYEEDMEILNKFRQ
ncbi:MAG: hypothetical protein V2I46_04030 [Bacteroides sp.]|jgi:hypothetical protein|nr:hypothetical protein [Bacteroides sp.]